MDLPTLVVREASFQNTLQCQIQGHYVIKYPSPPWSDFGDTYDRGKGHEKGVREMINRFAGIRQHLNQAAQLDDNPWLPHMALQRVCVSLIVAIFMFGLQTVGAEEVHLGCYLEPLITTPTDEGARVAGKFFQRDLLTFVYDTDKDEVRHETEGHQTLRIMLPRVRGFRNGNELKITFPNPNISGLVGRSSELKLSVNIYTLQATLTLAIQSKKDDKWYGFWARDGLCHRRKW